MPQPENPGASVELAVIINSFNRRNLLEKAISALLPALRELPFGAAVFVFEAGSTDGSLEFLEQWARENPRDTLHLVRPAPGEDTSFSAGVNAACTAASSRYPTVRWLFLYETDNWIAGPEPLLHARNLLVAQPGLAAAGFTVRRHDGARAGYGVRFPTVASFVAGQNLTAALKLDRPNASVRQRTGEFEWFTCDVVFTSPLLIRREAWEASGGIDAQMFPFSDSDLDWAWRCAHLGWGMAVIETDAVVHDNLAVASAWSANRVVDLHRSRMRLLKRHRGAWIGIVKPLLFARHAVESLLLARSAGRDDAGRKKLEKRIEMRRTVWRDYQA